MPLFWYRHIECNYCKEKKIPKNRFFFIFLCFNENRSIFFFPCWELHLKESLVVPWIHAFIPVIIEFPWIMCIKKKISRKCKATSDMLWLPKRVFCLMTIEIDWRILVLFWIHSLTDLTGAREFVRSTRKTGLDDLLNSAIAGFGTGALLGRLQGWISQISSLSPTPKRKIMLACTLECVCTECSLSKLLWEQ